MQKITERGKAAGLLEPEQAPGRSRARPPLEKPEIPDPLLEPSGDAEADDSLPRVRRRPQRRGRGKFRQSRFSWTSPWLRLVAISASVIALAVLAAAGWKMKSVMLHNPRFLLGPAESIQVAGNRVVTRPEVLAFFAPDAGRSIFAVPLARRQAQIESLPWVRRATVMRLWPDRLRIQIVERTPVAFARGGNGIRLIDEQGVVLDLPDAAAQHYSFPVLTGVASSVPLAMRASRIAAYRKFAQALDAGGGDVSAALSEVDLSDPEDIRAVFAGGSHPPLVHLGNANFLPRYRAYRAHLAEWLQQYPRLQSVDMRYGRQVVLDTGMQPPALAAGPLPPANPLPAAAQPSAIQTRAKSSPTRHAAHRVHRARLHRHAAPRPPERGHRVRHPLMHVVTGM